ncbi:MAG: O-antigen ligase family protein [Bryobacterales bacterium]|nr:O-antigen ligase family protein [Bryobacterales bacterium]
MPRFSPLPRNDAEFDVPVPVHDTPGSENLERTRGEARSLHGHRAIQTETSSPGIHSPRMVSGETLAEIADARNPATSIHWLAFLASVTLLFLKGGNIPELSYAITGANLKLLYFVVPFAYLGIFVGQGLDSTLRNKSVIFFLLFYVWMVMATPTSSWVGGSVGRVKDFGLHVLPLVLVIPATIVTWKQIRLTFGVMALSAAVVLVSTRFFGEAASGRISLESSGTIGNSNDLAAHLLLMLSFVLYVFLDPRRNILFRGAALLSMAYGLYIILGTGSRGALVALALGGIFFFFKAPIKIRMGFLVAAVLAITIMPLVLPEATKARLGSLFGEEHLEAEESGESRGYLFRKSLEYTLAHPIFGVGPDQFANYEGKQSRAAGLRGNWHQTHCAWTQVSSECGIPAFLFLCIALGTAFTPLFRCYSSARKLGVTEVSRACLCLLLGSAMILTAVTFLSQAYHFYFAFLIGMAIVTARAGQRQLALVASRAYSLPR